MTCYTNSLYQVSVVDLKSTIETISCCCVIIGEEWTEEGGQSEVKEAEELIDVTG